MSISIYGRTCKIYEAETIILCMILAISWYGVLRPVTLEHEVTANFLLGDVGIFY